MAKQLLVVEGTQVASFNSLEFEGIKRGTGMKPITYPHSSPAFIAPIPS